MGIELITEYPFWLSSLCVLCGGAYSFLLYYKNKSLNDIPATAVWIMAISRFLLVSILSFLLLSPLLKYLSTSIEKPILVFAQDNSLSIVCSKDSAYYRNEYKSSLSKLMADLDEHFEVKHYTLGEKVKQQEDFSFEENITDISSIFNETASLYSGRNLGAIILSTDGIYNRGISPLYEAPKVSCPIFTIALGDTNIRKDVLISKINYNSISFLGNDFPIEVQVNAQKCKNEKIKLLVYEKGTVIYTGELTPDNDNFSGVISFSLTAKKAGIRKYSFVLQKLKEEENIINNATDIYIDVLDNRQKILVLSSAPCPDAAVIKHSLSKNINYEISSMLMSERTENPAQYSLVILHGDIFAHDQAKALINEFKKNNTSLWFISPQKYDELTGITLKTVPGKYNESFASQNEGFSLFSISDNLANLIKSSPPVSCPLGTYQSSAPANILLYQKIGTVKTNMPLLQFTITEKQRTGTFSGEGLWKWKLYDQLKNENTNAFDELINKTVQFLSSSSDKSNFRVNGKKIFHENENITLDAELYNASYELYNEPEVKIDIIDSAGSKYPFLFNKWNASYKLDAGTLPAGEYTFEASTEIGDKKYSKKGGFCVTPIKIESVNTVADHNLLNKLSKRNSGEMIYPDQINTLKEKLLARNDIKPVSYSDIKLIDLIHFKWLFAFLMLLIVTEWFLKKFWGAY